MNDKRLNNWMIGGVTLGVIAFQFVPEAMTGDGAFPNWFRIVGAGAAAGIGGLVGGLIGRVVAKPTL